MDDTFCATHKRTMHILSELAEISRIPQLRNLLSEISRKRQANEKWESSVGKDKWRI